MPSITGIARLPVGWTHAGQPRRIAWAVGELRYELGRVGLAAAGGPDGVAARWAQQPGRSPARKLASLLAAVGPIAPHAFHQGQSAPGPGR